MGFARTCLARLQVAKAKLEKEYAEAKAAVVTTSAHALKALKALSQAKARRAKGSARVSKHATGSKASHCTQICQGEGFKPLKACTSYVMAECCHIARRLVLRIYSPYYVTLEPSFHAGGLNKCTLGQLTLCEHEAPYPIYDHG